MTPTTRAAAQAAVAKCVRLTLNVNQVEALIRFCMAIGAAKFRRSSLLGFVNAGDFEAAKHEFALWVYVGGNPDKKAARARKAEAALFVKPVEKPKPKPKPVPVPEPEPEPVPPYENDPAEEPDDSLGFWGWALVICAIGGIVAALFWT